MRRASTAQYAEIFKISGEHRPHDSIRDNQISNGNPAPAGTACVSNDRIVDQRQSLRDAYGPPLAPFTSDQLCGIGPAIVAVRE